MGCTVDEPEMVMLPLNPLGAGIAVTIGAADWADAAVAPASVPTSIRLAAANAERRVVVGVIVMRSSCSGRSPEHGVRAHKVGRAGRALPPRAFVAASASRRRINGSLPFC